MAKQRNNSQSNKPSAPIAESVSAIEADATFIQDLPIVGYEAQVNQRTRHSTVIAFSGAEFVRYEWRDVPAGFEAQAEAHPFLVLRPKRASLVVSAQIEEAVEEAAVSDLLTEPAEESADPAESLKAE
jgi:hypothetical protein